MTWDTCRRAEQLPGRGVDMRADPQRRAERQHGAAEPEQCQQPGAAPPPGREHAEHGEDGQHQAVRRDAVVGRPGVAEREVPQPEVADLRRRRDQAGQPGRVLDVGLGQQAVGQRGPARPDLLDDRHQLRAGQHHRGQRGQPGRPQFPGQVGRPEQPVQQDQRGRDDGQQRDLLVSQHGRGQDHAEDQGRAPARPAGQPHRRFEGQRDEQLARGQVQVVPGAPDQHRGQAEERARRDRAGLRRQPQPGHPVRRVAEQAGHGHR